MSVRISGGGGAAIGGSIAGGTTGSVLFVNPDNTIAQDNQSFYWNDSSNTLSLFPSLTSEILTNGTLTGSATGWTVPSGMAYSSNSVSKTSNGTGALSQTPSSLYLQREHILVVTISTLTTGTVTPSLGGWTGTAISASGTYPFRFVPTSSTALNLTPSNTARFTIQRFIKNAYWFKPSV